jgi:hypothetical protein
VSVLGIIILLPLIYSIIWFERYGSDNKRPLLNKLVSSICWLGVFWFLVVQPIDVLR